jgi:putative hemolysin
MTPPRPNETPMIDLARFMPGAGPAARLGLRAAERLLGISRINGFYAAIPPRQAPEDLFPMALDVGRVTLDCPEADRARIPATGPCIVVANHPFGMIEGIALMALLAPIRKDVRFLGNFLLDQIPEMRPFNIAVDPFGGTGSQQRNVPGMRAAHRWLEQGGMLVLFPSGEVAHLHRGGRRVEESAWAPSLARLVRRSGAPVLPMHFAGRNSAWFQMLGLVHPMLRTLRLPGELLNKFGHTLRLTVGEAIPAATLCTQPDDAALMADLRARTLALEAARPAPAAVAPPMAEVAPAEPIETLVAEIEGLPPECRLFETKEYVVYAAEAERLPHVLHEIGRQRELAFRAVGEGTGKPLDLDRFDPDYHHLFVWNPTAREIVGSYRIGVVEDIVRRRGLGGLYTTTLFHYDHTLLDSLGPALELGRSFVRAEYQRSFGALHLLWCGIGRFVAQRPRHRHLMGAVSISDAYSTMSQQLMTAFLESNHMCEVRRHKVRPRNPVAFEEPSEEVAAELPNVTDLESLSERVQRFEGGQRDIPVLLRRYLGLGGRILGVNRDPDFANVVDGLVVIDLLRAPRRVVERYLGADGLRAVAAAAGESSSVVA